MSAKIQQRARLAGGADNRWEIMTRLYHDRLSELVSALQLGNERPPGLEVKHFFNGAALYAGNLICASWSPVGLAFRLPDDEVSRLIESGRALPLKYFAKGHVKKGYALFEDPGNISGETLNGYFLRAIEQAVANA